MLRMILGRAGTGKTGQIFSEIAARAERGEGVRPTRVDLANGRHQAEWVAARIKKLMAVVGGSMGGMLACQWPILYPETVGSVMPKRRQASKSA